MVGNEEHIYENPQVVIQGAYKKNPSRKSSAKGAHKNIQRTTSLPVDNYDYNEESPKLPKKAHSKESSNKSWLHSAGTPGTLPLSSPPDTVYQNTPPATPVRYDPPENSFQDSPTSSYPSTSSYNEFQYGEYEYTDDIPSREYQNFPEPPPEFRSPEIPDEEMDYNRTLPRDQLPDCFRYNTLGKVVQKDSDRLPYYNQDRDGFATLRDALKTQRRAARKASREAEPEEEDSGGVYDSDFFTYKNQYAAEDGDDADSAYSTETINSVNRNVHNQGQGRVQALVQNYDPFKKSGGHSRHSSSGHSSHGLSPKSPKSRYILREPRPDHRQYEC